VQQKGGQPDIVAFRVRARDIERLQGKIFESPDQGWKDFVVNARHGDLNHTYDYVEGPVVRNPPALMKGRMPTALIAPDGRPAQQLAIFTKRAVYLFNNGMRR